MGKQDLPGVDYLSMIVIPDIMVLDACQFLLCFLKWLRLYDLLVLCIGSCGFWWPNVQLAPVHQFVG
jgi:hypothetical protein